MSKDSGWADGWAFGYGFPRLDDPNFDSAYMLDRLESFLHNFSFRNTQSVLDGFRKGREDRNS